MSSKVELLFRAPHDCHYVFPDLWSEWNIAIDKMDIAVNRLTIYSLTSEGRPEEETTGVVTDDIDLGSMGSLPH